VPRTAPTRSTASSAGTASAGERRVRQARGRVAAALWLVSGGLDLARPAVSRPRDRRSGGGNRPLRCGRGKQHDRRNPRRDAALADDCARDGDGRPADRPRRDADRSAVDTHRSATGDDDRTASRRSDGLARGPEWVHRRARVDPGRGRWEIAGARAGPVGLPSGPAAGRGHRLEPLLQPPSRVLRGLQRDLFVSRQRQQCPVSGEFQGFRGGLRPPDHPLAVLSEGNGDPDFVTGPWTV
jgi:hypothetical protein